MQIQSRNCPILLLGKWSLSQSRISARQILVLNASTLSLPDLSHSCLTGAFTHPRKEAGPGQGTHNWTPPYPIAILIISQLVNLKLEVLLPNLINTFFSQFVCVCVCVCLKLKNKCSSILKRDVSNQKRKNTYPMNLTQETIRLIGKSLLMPGSNEQANFTQDFMDIFLKYLNSRNNNQ